MTNLLEIESWTFSIAIVITATEQVSTAWSCLMTGDMTQLLLRIFLNINININIQ